MRTQVDHLPIPRTAFVRGLFAFLVLSLFPSIVGGQSIEDLKRGVVKITAQVEGQQPKVGTGFIVRLEKDGAYVVTASHVVQGDPKPQINFFLQPQQSFTAQIIGIESENQKGLAALLISGAVPEGLVALSLDQTSLVAGGEPVTFIGFPRTLAPWAVSTGSLSGLKGLALTFQALVEEGHSGGPLLLSGKVVGVVTDARERIGYAVPSSILEVALRGWQIRPEGSVTREIIGKDGAPMVLIPAGEFWMGSPDDEGDKDEHPKHKVFLDAFYMDKFEVTVSGYEEFFRSTVRQKPDYWDGVDIGRHSNLPVVGVDWHDADAYCRWAGKRLPTEAEWEKAARGTDGRTYPWGNGAPTASLANFGKDVSARVKVYGQRLAPVESHEAGRSPYGVYNMAGNVWEWVADWYDDNYYRANASRNPTGPAQGEYKVFRGGSWANRPDDLRSADRRRYPSGTRLESLGFRCAQDASR